MREILYYTDICTDISLTATTSQTKPLNNFRFDFSLGLFFPCSETLLACLLAYLLPCLNETKPSQNITER